MRNAKMAYAALAAVCVEMGHGYIGLMDELRITKGILTTDQMMSNPKEGLSILIR